MNIQDIKDQCESLSNEELLLVVNNKIHYTETIVRIARQELRKRAVPKEEIKKIRKKQRQQDKITGGDIQEDLLLFEKIAFFFLPLPFVHRLVYRDYRRRGYILKTRQSVYFQVAGAVFLVSLIICGESHLISLAMGALIWLLAFLAAFAFNQFYFKAWTIRRLAARSNPPENT